MKKNIWIFVYFFFPFDVESLAVQAFDKNLSFVLCKQSCNIIDRDENSHTGFE